MPAPAVEIDGVASSAHAARSARPAPCPRVLLPDQGTGRDITCVVTGRSDGGLARAVRAEADAALTAMTKAVLEEKARQWPTS